MPNYHYSEAGIRGRRTFDLEGQKLKICGKQGFGDFTLEVDLADIASHFERVKCINRGAIRRAVTYLGIVAVVAVLFTRQTFVPPIVVALAAFLVALPSLIVLFRFSRLIEIEQFRSRAAGVVVFDLILENKKAAEFEDFVKVLRSAVTAAQPTKVEADVLANLPES
jgi:hypothetical protein